MRHVLLWNSMKVIVTPKVKRIHAKVPQSVEVLFVDSTGIIWYLLLINLFKHEHVQIIKAFILKLLWIGTVEMSGIKLFPLMTNSFAGGIPLRLIMVTSEKKTLLQSAFTKFKELLDGTL